MTHDDSALPSAEAEETPVVPTIVPEEQPVHAILTPEEEDRTRTALEANLIEEQEKLIPFVPRDKRPKPKRADTELPYEIHVESLQRGVRKTAVIKDVRALSRWLTYRATTLSTDGMYSLLNIVANGPRQPKAVLLVPNRILKEKLQALLPEQKIEDEDPELNQPVELDDAG